MAFRGQRYGEAARVAALVANYVHPRLSATALTARPWVAEQLVALSDEVLGLERLAGFSDDDDDKAVLATVKPRGSA